MKKFVLLALMLSTSVFAAKNGVIFPQVYNFRYNVQIQVWNHTEKTVTCSGPINLTMEDGTYQSEYYFDSVTPRFTSYRTIYGRVSGVDISHVQHSIMCF